MKGKRRGKGKQEEICKVEKMGKRKKKKVGHGEDIGTEKGGPTLLKIKVLHDTIEEPFCLNGSIKNL